MKKWPFFTGGLLILLFFIITFSIKDIEAIWLQTRIIGLLSYLFLFLTVLIGELRVLTKIKARFRLFKLHIPVAIISITLVFMHLVSAAIDNFKWGKTINFIEVLGFSFGDKWLVFLSLGTLAFYMMIIVAATSPKPVVRFLKYKNWKIIHYLSYAAFVMAYVHSINLGTDLKTGSIAVFLKPLFLISFLLVTSLLITRIAYLILNFSDQLEISIAAIFFIILIFGSAIISSEYIKKHEKLDLFEEGISQAEQEIDAYEKGIERLNETNRKIEEQIQVIVDG